MDVRIMKRLVGSSMSLENLATRIKESATAPPAKLPQKEESKAVDIREETPQVGQQPEATEPEPEQKVVSDGRVGEAPELAVEKNKKERDADVESLIVQLEATLNEGNYPKQPLQVPAKPWETIIDFEKCARRQISTYRAWVGNEGKYDYARIVAGRIRDLIRILDRMLERGAEVEPADYNKCLSEIGDCCVPN